MLTEDRKIIFNLTTGSISGVLAIIKISGVGTIRLINHLLEKKINLKISEKAIKHKKIIHQKKIIDDVILLIYPQNNSFDGNENIEIICHANKSIIEEFFAILISYGAVIATPGEFSKNAFLNNKISLEKLNAINNLIKTQNYSDKNFYLETIVGNKTPNVIKIQAELKNIISSIEVTFDYPKEKDYELVNYKQIKIKITKMITFFCESIIAAKQTTIDENIFSILIVGKTNTGKSTLFNQISPTKKNITSSKKKTTRDSISSLSSFNNYNFKIIDTAGFYLGKKTELDEVAIKNTYIEIKKANLIIFLTEYIQKKSFEKQNKLLEQINKLNNNVILIVNKADKLPQEKWKKNYISALTKNIINLQQKILPFLKKSEIKKRNIIILGSEFQIATTKAIISNFKKYLIGLENEVYDDALIYLLYENYKKINVLQGIDININIMDNIFSNFCIGK